MLFFNTEFDIYPNAQSPGFKPDTVSQSPGFKPDTVSQSPGFKPGTISQNPSFKLGTVTQSSGFKPDTISQSPGFKPNTVSQSPDFKPSILLKAQALNLALLSKAQALNLTLTPFTYPTFKHKLSKISKKNIRTTNNLINKELRNPDSPSLMEIRRSKVKTLSGSLKPKKIFCLLYLNLFLGKINVLKNHTQITYLIKGTVLGRAWWGC